MQLSLPLSVTRREEISPGRNFDLSIEDAFVQGNPRIQIISGGGIPTPIPAPWRPILRDSDVLVAVPDMHMFLYTSNQDNFKYGAEPMLDFLIHAEACRLNLATRDKRLSLYQLGDMYELCFPHPKQDRFVSVRDIRSSHPIYEEIIRLFHELGFEYIIGNHDFEHRSRRGGSYVGSDGSVYLEHGYSADRWFHFTNPDHRYWQLSMRAFRKLRRLEARVSRLEQALSATRNRSRAPIGINSGEQERSTLPDPQKYSRRQLRYYDEFVRQSATHPRVCVIAHTHLPHLAPQFASGECIYVDAGAWTEGRSDFVVITNSEVAICRYSRTVWQNALPALRAAV